LGIGQHLVLSTTHLAARTAHLLEEWAWDEPSDRPLVVASTHYGWFVATEDVCGPDRARIPGELLAAMNLGRERGCSYLLFDCDGPINSGLSQFAW
jgi:hypothetical protein